jgi:mannan endo-1,4-beta-mannosidase
MLRRLIALALVVSIGPALGAAGAAPAFADSSAGFVTRTGSELKLDGKPFKFFGSNNYYLMYKSRLMTDDVFNDAQAAGFTVLRTWGWLDLAPDGSGASDGVSFQSWDAAAGHPVYNDGPNGLERLDYVLYRARQAGVKLVIPFTNNWADFGGMDQYVRWAGKTYHDDFYRDAQIRGWYKDWINHVLNRVNTLTGIAYKDDPTVMTWELGNEPRCQGSGAMPTSDLCGKAHPETITNWADEMSRYVKSVDAHHLVSVGEEGFTCDHPDSDDWNTNCGPGTDSAALTALPAVDVMSFHLYPDYWGTTPAWGTQWIKDHITTARNLRKASMLGEFGWKDKGSRDPVYQQWTAAVREAGGNGFLYWILSGVQDDSTLYPDYDGFTVYCPSPECTAISNGGQELVGGLRSRAPVADHDAAVTPFGTAVSVNALGNDIAYRTYLRPSTLDLDPAAAGIQSSVTVAGGTFTAASGTVSFTPASGFAGKATAHYVVRDAAGRLSNVADIVVTVKPDPTAAIVLASWESGLDGWAPGNWQSNAGTLSQTSAFHTDGAFGMHVDAHDGGWFGYNPAEPLNLTGKSILKYDLSAAPEAGTSTAIAFQVGPSWTWCQGPFTWVNQGTAATLEVDLLSGLSCDAASLNEIHGFLIYISSGQFDVDYVRAE